MLDLENISNHNPAALPRENEMSVRKTLAVIAAAAGSAFGPATMAQTHGHDSSAGSGKVHFQVDCNESAQREFNTALAYFHSFDQVGKNRVTPALDRALAADSTCGMAHWLRALALLDNPFAWPGAISAKAKSDAVSALESARKTGLKSQRERDYVDALSVYFNDFDKQGHPARMNALVSAFEQLAARYPDDSEASVFYALFLSVNFDPSDKNYTNQLRAAAILEPLYAKQPQHPGLAHYLIHSYDYPALASRGVEVAKRYAKIAPDAPHALHMPSHIFTLTGLWRDSIDANRAAAASAGDTTPAHHALDYMAYAQLQLGEAAQARETMRRQQSMKVIESFTAAYSYAAIPARVAIETDSWDEAAKLPQWPSSEGYAWKKFAPAEAVNVFARGIGLAMKGATGDARKEAARLVALRDAAAPVWGDYWAEQIDIQAELVRAIATYFDGQRGAGISALQSAANRQDAREKHVVAPGPVVPAREMLATMLMVDGRPRDAFLEYEKVLAKEPNRLRALKGMAKSAQQAGDAKNAELYAEMVSKQTRLEK